MVKAEILTPMFGGYPMFATGLASDDAFIFSLALRDRLVTVNSASA